MSDLDSLKKKFEMLEERRVKRDRSYKIFTWVYLVGSIILCLSEFGVFD